MSLQINSSYAPLKADYAQDRNPRTEHTPAGQERAREKKQCTTNTDQVDQEIKQLREKKKQLEQQLERAVGDEKKCRELEKQLAQINAQLAHKDNDTYRRQHASISM